MDSLAGFRDARKDRKFFGQFLFRFGIDYECVAAVFHFTDIDDAIGAIKSKVDLGTYWPFVVREVPPCIRLDVDAGDALQAVGFFKNGRRVLVVANHNPYSVEAKLPAHVSAIYLTDKTRALTPQPIAPVFPFPSKSVTTIILTEKD